MKELVITYKDPDEMDYLKYIYKEENLKKYNIKIVALHSYDLTKGFELKKNQVLIDEHYEAETIEKIQAEIGTRKGWKIFAEDDIREVDVNKYTFDFNNQNTFFETKKEAKQEAIKRLRKTISFMERKLEKSRIFLHNLLDTELLWDELEKKRKKH